MARKWKGHMGSTSVSALMMRRRVCMKMTNLDRDLRAHAPASLKHTSCAAFRTQDVFEGFVSHVVVQHRCPHSPARLYQLALAGDRADKPAGGGRAEWLTRQGLAPWW